MISEWVEKCWSLVLGEEWLTVEIKRHSTRSIKSMHQEKESRQSHYLILGKAAQERKEGRKEGRKEEMKGGMVNRSGKRVGANRRNSGADLDHPPRCEHIRQQQTTTATFHDVG